MRKNLFKFIALASTFVLTSCGEKVDNSIEVSFSWNFETTIANPDPIRINPGEAYGELPAATIERDGFTFEGWNLRRDGKGENVTSSTLTSSDAIDHTLYANWAGKQYTVSFDLHGGTINGQTSIPDATVTCGNIYGALVIPQNPTKKLSTFLGWYLDEEGTGKEITYSSKVTTPSNHTLHAVFKDIKLDYTFESEKDLEDFSSVDDALSLSIVNNTLEIKNPSDDPRAYLVLNSNLRAGSSVHIDAEFVGEANAEDNVRAGLYVYGLNSEGGKIEGGNVGDPRISSTREEIKNWYNGQGANNVQSWELEKWNNGHMDLKMNILEDCSGVYFMFDFGRKKLDDETVDFNPELWQNNKWVIHSIHIDYADYELLKDEYDFKDSNDIQSFIHPQNVKYKIDEDHSLKIEKGESEENSYLEFETQYIKKGSRVTFEIEYVGDLAYSSSNLVGVFSYGNYPNGMILDKKLNENGYGTAALDSDSPFIKYFYWGTYGATNEGWAPIKLVSGQKSVFTNYLYEDAYGITLRFKFGSSNGYFKITHVKIEKQEPISEFDFSEEKQLKYFNATSSTSFALDGDEKGDLLKVASTNTDPHHLYLSRLVKKDQKVKIKLSYVTSDPVFVNGKNQFTFLISKRGYDGKNDGGVLKVMGNAPWDGGWDSTEIELEATVDGDCYGFDMEFVFNGVEDSYFRISSITIE